MNFRRDLFSENSQKLSTTRHKTFLLLKLYFIHHNFWFRQCSAPWIVSVMTLFSNHHLVILSKLTSYFIDFYGEILAQTTAPDEISANTEAPNANHTMTKEWVVVENSSVSTQTVVDKENDESGTLNQITFNSKGFHLLSFKLTRWDSTPEL